MVYSKKEAELRKRIKEYLRESCKTGKIAVVTLSDMKGSSVFGMFHRNMGAKSKNELSKRVLKFAKALEVSNSNTELSFSLVSQEEILAIADKHRESNYSAISKPFTVLMVLTDQSQFNRGKGGKSASAIQKWMREQGFFMSIQDIEGNLQVLRGIGIVSKAITGAWWPKVWFRESMRERGISFLPTIEKKY